jgi:hypothetical protein
MSRLILIGSIVLAAGWCALAATPVAGQAGVHAGCSYGFGLGVKLPINKLPADIVQNRHTGNGTLTLAFPSFSTSVSSRFTNPSAKFVGTATKSGCNLLLTFTTLSYRVDPISLPTGQQIGRQVMNLDPYRPSTILVNGQTGKITRNLHWVLTATNALYNGSHSIALVDQGKSTTQGFRNLGGNHYSFTIRTAWHSLVTLRSFRVNGNAQPTGTVDARAAFTGTYVLAFKK